MTSIEFIIDSILSRGIYTKEMLEEFEQAKEMHKSEMEEARLQGYGEGYDEGLYDAEYK